MIGAGRDPDHVPRAATRSVGVDPNLIHAETGAAKPPGEIRIPFR
jgi:hypothetical protein